MDSLPQVSQEALTLIKEHVPEEKVRAWAKFLRENPELKTAGVLVRPGTPDTRTCYCALGAGLHLNGVQDATMDRTSLFVETRAALIGLGAPDDIPDPDIETGHHWVIFDGIAALNDDARSAISYNLNLPWPAIADILESIYE